MRYLAVVAAVVCVLAGSALGQGTFRLEFRESTVQETPALRETALNGQRSAAKPEGVGALPDGLPAEVSYFCFGPDDAPWWVLATSGEKPVLYVDTDRDGNLAEEKPVAGTRDPASGIAFALVTLPAGDGRSACLRMNSHTRSATQAPACLHAVAGGCRQGQVTLAGKTYRVALLDGDQDGRYTDGLAGPLIERTVDAVAIDLDGNGKCEAYSGSQAPEWGPLAKGLTVDGKFYKVAVPADGASIELTLAEPAYGHLDLGPHQVRLAAFSDAGHRWFETKGEKVRVPAGRYATASLQVGQTAGGADWQLRTVNDPGEVRTFEVKPGETLAMPLGAPLTAMADVELSGRTVQLACRIVGRSGEWYYPGVMKGSTRLGAPALEIVDADGKTLYSGKFAFG